MLEVLNKSLQGHPGGPLRWILDAVVLLAVISLGSLLFDRNPLGWIATNPTPFLLVPLLIGGRYGIFPGIIAGFLSIIPLVFRSGLSIAETFTVWTYTLLCLPLAGLISGEVHRLVTRNLKRDELELRHARLRLRALDQQIHLLTEVKEELDRELALVNAGLATLDFEIRRVLQATNGRFYESLLGLLERKGRLEEAAVYVRDENGLWVRKTWIGAESSWPETRSLADSRVAMAALQNACIASLPEIWQGGYEGDASDFLVACPLGAGSPPQAVVLVKTMPFASLNRKTLTTMDVICRWISEYASIQSHHQELFDRRGILSESDFAHMLGLACIADRKLHLPSSVLVIRSSGKVAAERMLEAVRSAIRVGDVLTAREFPTPHLFLLLPLTGPRGAEICLARFREHALPATGGEVALDGSVLTTADFEDFPGLVEKASLLLQ